MRWFDPAYQNLIVGSANTTLDGSESTLISQGGALREANILDLAGTVNVKSPTFGAKGNGTNDDTAAIAAAITASTGAVYIPAGTYKITSTLSLKKNLLIFGDGANASILNYTGAGVAVQAIGSLDNWKSCVRDLKISTSTGTHGLRLKDLADFDVENVYVTGFSTAGFHLTGTASTGMCICVRLFKNWILANTGAGILADSVNNINQIAVHGNRIQGNGGKGINLQAAGIAWSILGNDIEGNSDTDLYINGGSCSGVHVAGNYFEQASNHAAIVVADTQDQVGVNITANEFQGDTSITTAILLGVSAFARGVSVQNNNFTGSYTNAVNVGAAIGVVLGPNRLGGSINHVASVSSSSTGLKIFNANQRFTVTYSASMTIDTTKGEEFDITATDGNAFTINAPTNPWDGSVITVTIRNAAGGALGAVTWNVVFKMSTWTQPGNGNSRSITFKYNGTNWVQISQTGVDVPN